MVRQEGSRWDVGTKDNAITLERFDDGDERVSEDVLQVEQSPRTSCPIDEACGASLMRPMGTNRKTRTTKTRTTLTMGGF